MQNNTTAQDLQFAAAAKAAQDAKKAFDALDANTTGSADYYAAHQLMLDTHAAAIALRDAGDYS